MIEWLVLVIAGAYLMHSAREAQWDGIDWLVWIVGLSLFTVAVVSSLLSALRMP